MSADWRLEVQWSKLQPGRLEWKLGELAVTQSRVRRNEASVSVHATHEGIILRNLMATYPGYISKESIWDRIWPDPDSMPEWHQQALSTTMKKLRTRMKGLGVIIISRYKVGYRLEFIPQWRGENGR